MQPILLIEVFRRMASVPSEVSAGMDNAVAEERARERELEKVLVQRAIEKDGNAFAELYDKHVVRVYRHHGPEGVFARTWLTGSAVLWVLVLLFVALIVYYA